MAGPASGCFQRFVVTEPLDLTTELQLGDLERRPLLEGLDGRADLGRQGGPRRRTSNPDRPAQPGR